MSDPISIDDLFDRRLDFPDMGLRDGWLGLSASTKRSRG